jgi:hypothetical protein
MNIFAKLKAYENSSENPKTTLFVKLNEDFKKLFPKFPQNPNYKIIYETCLLQTEKLAKSFDAGLYLDFKAQCFFPLQQTVNEIKSKYMVNAVIKAVPKS